MSETRRHPTWPWAALLAGLGFAIYAGSLPGPFVYDDLGKIVADPAIRTIWPIGGHPNRPVLTLSLALNHAVSGLDPYGFRLTNVVIHVLAALLLFGIVRRTLRTRHFADRFAPRTADAIGFAVAALWVAHPLHTQAVTYVWQRSESMAGMFFLATVYCTVRLAEGSRRRLWLAAALACCALGLGTKEVMVAVFPTLLLFDGILLAPSFREALRERRVLYGVFATVAIALAAIVLPRTHTSFGDVTPWQYAVSQPGIVLEYLRLALWPSPLCFDYQREPATGFWETVPQAVAIAALLAGTVWGIRRRSWAGVAGAWFFLILAPTSSFVVINDLMVEYRTYLPLAAVVVFVVAGGRALCRRARVPAAVPLAAAVIALGAATVQRNRVFATHVSLWESVLEIEPDNFRAHSFLVGALLAERRFDAALEHARRAVALRPDKRLSHWNLGMARKAGDDLEGALEAMETARRMHEDASAQREIGELLARLGRVEEAIDLYHRSLAHEPRSATTWLRLATALDALDRHADVADACRRAVELDPGLVDAWRLLGSASNALQTHAAAAAACERALALRPTEPALHHELGRAYAALGRYAEALHHLGTALRGDPGLAAPLGETALRVVSGAGPQAEKVMAVRVGELAAERTGRQDAGVLASLARIYAAVGRGDLAQPVYEQLLALPAVRGDAARRREYERELSSLR